MPASPLCRLLAFAPLVVAVPSYAQTAPPKQVRLMVGFAAGGASDITARMIAPKLAEAFQTPFIVENRGGSGGLIATEAVSKAPPDGSMLLLMPAADAVQPAVRSRLPYDLERDFTPVARIVTGPWFLVVHPSVPARSVRELVALARAQPKKLNYATSGVGSSAHLSALVFSALANIEMVHVPYKGTSDGVTATAAGETDMIFASIPASKPLLAAKKIRVLGVSTRNRTELAPEQPTLHEAGVPGYDRSGWYGLLAPAGVPRDYVTRLNATIARVVDTREMKEAFNRQGLEPATTTPEAFGRFIRAEVAQNVKVVKSAGIRID
ncbi:MAG TPA: tripartite tricarboxylate transporter substrate binding protein [Burkholderiales bacterium]|nr:tripartite tricarboxylate transporter substrate binding protein [Burkholderiales bacterium]